MKFFDNFTLIKLSHELIFNMTFRHHRKCRRAHNVDGITLNSQEMLNLNSTANKLLIVVFLFFSRNVKPFFSSFGDDFQSERKFISFFI